MGAPRFHQIALNLLLVWTSILLALLAAEGTLRVAADRILKEGETVATGTIFNLDDPPLGFTLVPGSSRIYARGGAFLVRDRINSLGLRDVERAAERRSGVPRILVLGDSFMFGDGVAMEKTMPRRLEALMPGTEVINAGVRAWDLGQEFLYFRYRGHRFRPDLVLLAFFVNDLAPERGVIVELDAEGLPVSYRRHPDLARRDRETAPRGVTGAVSTWLRERSMLYTLLRERVDRWKVQRRAVAAPPKDHAADTPFLGAFVAEPTGEAAEAWSHAHRVLYELKRISETGGAKMAVILIPAPWQISVDEWNRWVEWLGVPPGLLSRRKPQEMVLSWCERSETPCFDLLGDFESGDRKALYFLHDHHWTEAGHDFAARRVARFLADNGLP